MCTNALSRIWIIIAIFFCSELLSAQKFKDKTDPFYPRMKGVYYFENTTGFGAKDDLGQLPCSSSFVETNSTWMKFVCEKEGILTFVVNPLQGIDDIDFILFKTAKDNKLEVMRCMASGLNATNLFRSKDVCLGATGLNLTSLDDFERSGCKINADNFLKFLWMNKGEEYYLLVNNLSSEKGFTITFDGTASLSESTTNFGSSTLPISHINLYPNPANNILNVEYFVKEKKTLQYIITDVTGKELIKGNTNGQAEQMNKIQINVQNLIAGVYVLNLITDGIVVSNQFIKI